MDEMDHLMAENKENNKESQKGQVTPKKYMFYEMIGNNNKLEWSIVQLFLKLLV